MLPSLLPAFLEKVLGQPQKGLGQPQKGLGQPRKGLGKPRKGLGKPRSLRKAIALQYLVSKVQRLQRYPYVQGRHAAVGILACPHIFYIKTAVSPAPHTDRHGGR